MTRLILDTCAVIELITSSDATELEFWNIIDDPNVMLFASFTLNEAQAHHDPSDHVIIAHAITEHITLLSSDQKFPFYRNQGLELIEY